MGRHRNMIAQTYMGSENITRVPSKEIDKLETTLDGKLPLGYGDFILRFGSDGRYNDELYVYPPKYVQTLNTD